jgi:DivIVA domain-containing protein
MARKKQEKRGQQQGFEPEGPRQRLTPVEIQQKVFRLAFRGYNERDVDEFLDHVTEDLAALHEENKRLREQLQEGGGGGSDAAQRRAEAIVREAREHAARLVEEAERRGATGAAPGPVPASFLVRERDFLQRLASLVQGHARALKDDARRGRPAKPAEGPAAVSAPEAEPPAAAASGGPAETAESAPEPSAATATDEPSPDTDLDEGARTEMSAAEGPRDASAAWGSAEESPDEAGPTPTSSPWTEERGPSNEEPSKDDPLLAAWESAFLGPEGQPPQGSQRPKGDQKEGEPSLRELFWGEE